MKHNAKKFAVPFFAVLLVLGMLAGAAWADTSTVSGQFVLDKTEVSAGGTINLAVLGLDSAGKVDIFGEQFGATIEAAVSSQLGTVVGGGTSGATPAAGAFAASVKYVLLVQGVGKCHITYAPSVSGTDTLTVVLQEQFLNEQGGITYKTIDTFTQNVVVNAVTLGAVGLDITKFEISGADAAPAASDTNPSGGIDGAMTAGVSGGKVTVTATSTLASGTVTLSLYNAAGTAYTFTGAMSGGTAIITLDSTVTAADTYYMKATLEGAAGDSIDMTDDDTLTVNPQATPKGLKLVSEKATISDDAVANAGTVVTAYLLDQYGNVTTNNSGAAIGLEFKDANAVVSDTALSISIANGSSKATDTLGDAAGEVLKLGTTSLVASVPASSTIADSNALAIKVADKNIIGILDATFIASQMAGVGFQMFDVALDTSDGLAPSAGADDNYQAPPGANNDAYLSAAAATTLVISHVVKGKVKETINVNVSASSVDVEGLFKKATGTITAATDEYWLIADSKHAFGECRLKNQGDDAVGDITAASPAAAKVVNGHGEEVTSLSSKLVGSEYQASLPEANLVMKDAYGNSIAGTASAAGTAAVTSDNGSVAVTGGDASFIPGQADTDVATIAYDPAEFSGTDTLTLSYTKPGVVANTLSVTVPVKSELDSIVVSVQQTTIPLNGAIPVTVETLDQNGKRYYDLTGVTINISGDVSPSVVALYGGGVVSGQNLDFSTETGRNVLTVTVPNKTGSFTLSFSNADGTVTAQKAFTVQSTAATPIALDQSALSIEAESQGTVNVSGGTAPYSISTDPASAIATAAISGTVVTVTGVAEGTTSLTVEDSAGSSATLSITVTAAAAPTDVPSGQNTTELTGDDIANAPVNLGSVVTGGDQMQVAVNFPAYAAAVDEYAAIALPDGSLFVLASDGSLTTDLVPYATGVTDASSVTVFDAFDVCTPFGAAVPTGTWSVYTLVVPTNGGDLDTIDFVAGDYDLQYYNFDVTCP